MADVAKRAAPSYFNKGNAYFFLKDYQRAADSYKKALKGNPHSKDYHFNIANARLELKELDAAIYHFKTVVELDKEQTYANSEAALSALASIYQDHLKDSKRALKVYRELLKRFPDNQSAKDAI